MMKLFTLFGNPVSHSKSPRMHNSALQELGLDACYTRTFLENGSTLCDTFKKMKLDGANITIPYKEDAFVQADELDSFAKQVGAVNTLVKKGNKIHGYNTDAPGFMKAIESFGKIENALVLGAGGTARALAQVLKSADVQTHILNRSINRLEYFKAKGFTAFSWEDFNPKSYDLIINTTSAGLNDNSLPIPELLAPSVFKKAKFAFDVIYNQQTPFITTAKSYDIPIKNGSEMLLYQAVLALNLFYDNTLDEDAITQSMRNALGL